MGKAADETDTITLMDGPYFHLGAGLVTHYIGGLAKDQNYFIQVQVDSISGTSISQKHHFGKNYLIFKVTMHLFTNELQPRDTDRILFIWSNVTLETILFLEFFYESNYQ